MTLDRSLHAAAAAAAGPAPTDDLSPWLARVAGIYEALAAQQSTLAARLDLIARIEAPREVRERGYGIVVGTVLEVREEHGRGVIVTRPDEVSEYGDDTYRTQWLNDGGAELVAEARALIGQRVRVWKYPEAHASKPGTTVRMAARIAPAGPRREAPAMAAAPASGNSRRHEAYDEPF
jgi:hypothetical protein